MLAVFTVTNLADAPVAATGEHPGTIRQAFFDANASSGTDSIVFQNGLSGTILLSAGELQITNSLELVGPGADEIVLDASGNDSTPLLSDGSGSRVLNIDDGIFESKLTVEISGIKLTGGDIAGEGGAIRSLENLSLAQTEIVGNAAFGASAKGGGIFSYASNLNINSSTISNNAAVGANANGGGIHHSTTLFGQQKLAITAATIANNSASSGGGIYTGNNLLEDQAFDLLNSTVSGNTASVRGGGIFNFDGRTNIRHSTITANQGPANQGSGLASFGDSSTATTVHSTIVSGNIGSDVAVVSGNTNSLVSEGYNLIGTGNTFGATNSLSALDNFTAAGDQTAILDPGLNALAANGGATPTHGLRSTSAALDAGDPVALVSMPGVPEFDQRGISFGRIEDGNGNGTPRIDIGAFEAQPQSADFDSDGDIDGADFLAWQRGFGTLSGASKSAGDADNDGVVDSIDLSIWQSDFGTSVPLQTTAFSSQLTVAAQDPNKRVPLPVQVAVTPPLSSVAIQTTPTRTVVNFSFPAPAIELQTLDEVFHALIATPDMLASTVSASSLETKVLPRDETANVPIDPNLVDRIFNRLAELL